MKETELRIGVIVDYDGPKPVTREDIRFLMFNIWDVDGVPLTEEWLIKLGFEQPEKHTYFSKEIREYKDFIVDYSDQSNDYFLCDTDVDTNIKYVHQLQNIYHALTGEELTIE